MKRVKRETGRNDAGYTLLLLVFMVATMIIAAAIATPNIITEGRRQKEELAIWRGNQYARAIGLYYRRFGRFPTKVEDLTNQTNGVRFLRQAYKDPMNKEDGSWRFIYIGTNGVLIGSNRQVSLLQGTVLGSGAGGGVPLGGPLGGLMTGVQNQGQGCGAPGVPVSSNPDGSTPAGCSSPESQPQPLGGSVMGGNIIGVGSKVDKTSLKVYLGENNYKNWEFIWNPLRAAAPGQPPANLNGPAAPPSGANTNGQQPPVTVSPAQ